MSCILWINGSFGSGKSTVARIIRRKVKDSIIFDPENIGYFFRKNFPKSLNPPDFQDEPLWREFNFKMLKHIADNYQGTVIVPMTLVNPIYYGEIIGRLRESGVRVEHFVLGAEKDIILKRLRKRLEFNSWTVKQADRCVKALRDPVFENYINTGKLTAKQAADIIIASAGLT